MEHKTDTASLEALNTIKPVSEVKRAIVFDCIFDNSPISDAKIAELLGWKINSVTPRRNELFNMGQIVSTGKHETSLSKVKVNLWRVASAEEKALFLEQKQKDKDKLIKKLKKEGRELAYSYFRDKGELTPSELMIDAFIGAYLIGKGV